jgi:hypothetical protein
LRREDCHKVTKAQRSTKLVGSQKSVVGSQNHSGRAARRGTENFATKALRHKGAQKESGV